MSGPLKGLKVLDFTTHLPGPYATMCLADMGAEVLRITSASKEDPTDFIPPFIPGTRLSVVTAYLGRGKRWMNLNLKKSKAIQVVHQLTSDYDIIVEQFRPGVMQKLGLDYENLRKINPSIIYCSITGYGQNGALTYRAGHDINYLSLSGLMSYSGRKNTGPTLTGMQIADVASGSNNAIIGILAAVIHRKETCKGQHIDIAMTDGAIAFNAVLGTCFLGDGHDPARESHFLNGGNIYDFYETKDGKYISFGGIEPKFIQIFFEKIGYKYFSADEVELKNIEVDKVKPIIRKIIMTKTRDQWQEIFRNVDACVEPVLTVSEALSSKYVESREMLIEMDVLDGGKIRQLANPIKFSESKQEYKSIGVVPGFHTKEVLLEIGYSEDDIIALSEEGVFI